MNPTKHQIMPKPPRHLDTFRIYCLLSELIWLVAALTLPSIGSIPSKEVISVCMLGAYLIIRIPRFRKIPPHILWLAFAMAMAIPGGYSTGHPEDFWQPLTMALVALTVMGLFAVEFNKREDLVIIAIFAILALPISCYTSIAKNDLVKLWAGGSRNGVNLLAFLLCIGCFYAMALRKSIPFVVLLLAMLISGSRTSVFTLVIGICLFPPFMRRISRYKYTLLISTIVLLLVCITFFPGVMGAHTQKEEILPSSSFSIKSRYSIEDIKETFYGRFDVAGSWLEYLNRHANLFGNGCVSYGSRDMDRDYPHNAIIHSFNGFGVPAGIIYTSVLIVLFIKYRKVRRFLNFPGSWAGAFFIAVNSRMFTEAQLFISTANVGGFLVSYGCGLAIVMIAKTSPADNMISRKKHVLN